MAKLWKVATKNAFSTTLNGGITDTAESLVLTSVEGLQSPGVLVIDRVDANGTDTPTVREFISYTSIVGKTISGLVRGLGGSLNQAHNSSAIVEEVFTVEHWNDLLTVLGDTLFNLETGDAEALLAKQVATPTNPNEGYNKLYFKTDGNLYALNNAGLESLVGGAFWNTAPGVPVRASNVTFTVTDTANANLYDKLYQKGVVLKWTDTGTVKRAMVVSSTYATNAVTVTIIGDVLASSASMNTMKVCSAMAQEVRMSVPGTLSTGTDLGNTWYAPYACYIFGADAYVKTAYTGSANTFDINDDGTTIYTTQANRPSIAGGATSYINAPTDMGLIAKDSAITVDVDATGTAPVGDGSAYLKLYVIPEEWTYRS